MGDELVQAINDFGFPIIAAFGLGYFVYYTWNWVVKEIKPVLDESTGTLIGSNAFILNGVLVEEYNQIDALCYISKDLKPKMISSVRHATKTIKQIK